jgi:hypothetical protein
MTARHPAQASPTTDPALEPPPRLFSPVFWIAIVFGLLCIVGGAGVALLGPRLFPARPAPAPAPAAQTAPPTVEQRLADIQARLEARQTAEAPPAAPPAAGEVQALEERVSRLETDRRRVTFAAAGALAAASLSEAASGSRPFAGELSALEASLPASDDLRALRPLAETGAPTPAALAAAYPDAAARAAVASRARTGGTGLMARIARAFAAIVTVRRVDRLEGEGVDAVLARAGKRVEDGDISGALSELGALPPAGRQAMAAWRTGAERRVEIDRRIAAVRGAALSELTRAVRETAAS